LFFVAKTIFEASLVSLEAGKSIESANKLTAATRSTSGIISNFIDKYQTVIIITGTMDAGKSPPVRFSQIYANSMTFRGVMFMFRVDLIVDPHDSYANHLDILRLFLHFTHRSLVERKNR
jgi:hypothetical protein